MKKYIFRVQDLKQGNMIPYNVLDLDEKTPENTETETFIALEIEESYDIDLFLYDKEKQEVRRKTKKELYDNGLHTLKIGEIFDETSQDFKTLDQPSRWHTWNGKTWEVDIKEVKDIVNEKWKVERQLKIDKDTNYKGFIFQTREYTDIHNFEQYGFLMMLGKAKQSDKVEWRMKDNSYHEFTVQELLEVVAIWGARKKSIFEDNKRMWLELEKAETVEEIEKIKWGV